MDFNYFGGRLIHFLKKSTLSEGLIKKKLGSQHVVPDGCRFEVPPQNKFKYVAGI